jgi:amino acid adenylation domain-containing protein
MAAVRHATLASGFLRSAERFPGRPAVETGGESLSYDELRRRATAIAAALATHAPAEPRLTAVFGSRSSTSFAGVLGALLRGHGYVPLNPGFPVERNRSMIDRSGCRSVVVDTSAIDTAVDTLSRVSRRLLVVLPDRTPSAAEQRRWAPHEVVGVGKDEPTLPESRADDPAYLLFTSGSTGRPKGVLVRQTHVRAFLDAIAERYDLDENDRLSQMFDLTFDLSAFDMFASWEHGACVCCPRRGELLKPSSFIRSAALTVWFSVPSVAMLLHRFRLLTPQAFPGLRLSLFCGEAFPSALARAWALAASNSVIENLYGPTEATIACTAHRWDPSEQDTPTKLVPIGRPLGATRVRVVGDSLQPLAPGQPGELVLGGPQVVDGYWDDDVATAHAFASLPDLGHAYRTGDRVVATAPDGPLMFLGRLDTQIKVLGHRVELEEVEAVILEEAGIEAIAVGWPRTPTGAAGIVALVAGRRVDPPELRRRLAARLPDYMVPRELRVVSELPLNANGKRDRQAAAAMLEDA